MKEALPEIVPAKEKDAERANKLTKDRIVRSFMNLHYLLCATRHFRALRKFARFCTMTQLIEVPYLLVPSDDESV